MTLKEQYELAREQERVRKLRIKIILAAAFILGLLSNLIFP